MLGQLKLALSNQRYVTSSPLKTGMPSNNGVYSEQKEVTSLKMGEMKTHKEHNSMKNMAIPR